MQTAKTFHVNIPLPTYGCDPSEVAVPWLFMKEAGIEVHFYTPNGDKPKADEVMLTGQGLGPAAKMLIARDDAQDAYARLRKDKGFCHPRPFSDLATSEADALLLPGGHDKAVKEYLESDTLQQHVVSFFRQQKPVAAICHGVVVVARSKNPETGQSVLYDYETTALTKRQESLAFQLTRLWCGDYYLTYPGLYVEDEVSACLKDKCQFHRGPLPLTRDSLQHLGRGFVVRDRHYLSARWPGDLYNFTQEFIDMVRQS